jgi:hypothetical protein
LKPSWTEVSKYGTEVKYYWNRIDSLEIKENILCRKWESEDGQTITWQIVIPDKLKASAHVSSLLETSVPRSMLDSWLSILLVFTAPTL